MSLFLNIWSTRVIGFYEYAILIYMPIVWGGAGGREGQLLPLTHQKNILIPAMLCIFKFSSCHWKKLF